MSFDPVTAQQAARAGRGDLFVGVPRDLLPIGDSITYGGQSGNADNTSTRVFGDTWPNYAAILSGGRLRLRANAGVSGNTTTQMLARLSSDVLQPLAAAGVRRALVPYLGGTNDEVGHSPFTSDDTANAAVTYANDVQMLTRIIAAGHIPVLCTIPPNNDNSFRRRIALVNSNKRELAHRFRVPLVDFHRVLVDRFTGNFLSYGLAGKATDSTHPNYYGLRDMAQEFWNTVEPLVAPGRPFSSASNPDSTNLYNTVLNPLLITASSPPVPDGWAFSGGSGYTASLGLRPHLADTPVATSTATGAGSGNHNLTQSISATGNWSAGDVLRFSVGIAMVGADLSANPGPQSIVQVKWNGGASDGTYMARYAMSADIPRGMIVMQGAAPAGATSLTIDTIFNGAMGQMHRWAPTIRNLTTTGIQG